MVFAMRRERAALQERLAQAEEERAYFQSKLDETDALREALASDEKRRSMLLETPADVATMPSPAGETGNSRVEDGRGARLEPSQRVLGRATAATVAAAGRGVRCGRGCQHCVC